MTEFSYFDIFWDTYHKQNSFFSPRQIRWVWWWGRILAQSKHELKSAWSCGLPGGTEWPTKFLRLTV